MIVPLFSTNYEALCGLHVYSTGHPSSGISLLLHHGAVTYEKWGAFHNGWCFGEAPIVWYPIHVCFEGLAQQRKAWPNKTRPCRDGDVKWSVWVLWGKAKTSWFITNQTCQKCDLPDSQEDANSNTTTFSAGK
jgi:hypothetical protein